MVSSWKLLTSTTWIVSGVDAATWPDSGVPRLPPTGAGTPAASRMRPVSAVVVDFPFVPVMATTRPRSQRDASSTSPMTGTPAARAADTEGWLAGTPGLSTTRSDPVSRPAGCDAERERHPERARSAAASSAGRRSVSVTSRAALDEQARGGHAAAGAADHDHPLPAHGERAHRHLPPPRVRLRRGRSAHAPAALTRSATMSVRMPRDPFTSTTSPGRSIGTSMSAAASLVADVPHRRGRHPGLDGRRGHRLRRRAADGDQVRQAGVRRRASARVVQRDRLIAEFEHLAEHRHAPLALALGRHGLEHALQRPRIRVVRIVDQRDADARRHTSPRRGAGLSGREALDHGAERHAEVAATAMAASALARCPRPISGTSTTAVPPGAVTVARVPRVPRSSTSVADTSASTSTPNVSTRAGTAPHARHHERVGGVGHDERLRRGALEDLGLGVGDGVDRREERRVHFRHVASRRARRARPARRARGVRRRGSCRVRRPRSRARGAARAATAAARCGC